MQKQYRLSQNDKVIAGVCGGLAEYFNIDPLLVRIGFVLFSFSFGGGLIAYILLWLLAPNR
jgi:phage shock protein C